MLGRRQIPAMIAGLFEGKRDALSRMAAEHMAMPFPPGFRGLEIEDQDMVMLDANARGHVTGVLKGPLSQERRATLAHLMTVFDKVLPAIDDGYASRYHTHVREMTALAAEIENLREKQSPARERPAGRRP